MTESLNVIALISGGKDSFYSILHCIQNGHKVIALANLYPPPPQNAHASASSSLALAGESADAEAEQDLNSFMYQTVGHTIIPLYERTLGIPLYRQPILGGALHTGTSYSPPPKSRESRDQDGDGDGDGDETESLIPLLLRIRADFPRANALSTGAILSTYQRTRVESVAVRLGLTPLSYLWQYPTLPPGTQTSLLKDMLQVGLEARIVKVASGGLDESFLWENVASEKGMGRVERSMRRFGVEGDGGVLGEGGEFETLVLDGPGCLFRGRIVVGEEGRRVVREGGGAARLSISGAEVVMKTGEVTTTLCRVPDVLDRRFEDVRVSLTSDVCTADAQDSTSQKPALPFDALDLAETKTLVSSSLTASQDNIMHWTVTGSAGESTNNIADEAAEAISKVKQLLDHMSLSPSSILSTTIILRSMQDFASINSVYGQLFTAPNPPSRVTISCGDLLPTGINIIIHLKVTHSPLLKALHVQSRSYWAPANIGPYSQATTLSIPPPNDQESPLTAVAMIAGQIPLLPSTMALPSPSPKGSELEDFTFQAVLSLQHLFRIGVAMSVSWFTGTVAYLPSSRTTSLPTSTRAVLAGQAWKGIHARPSQEAEEEDDDDDDSRNRHSERDLWEEKFYAGVASMGRVADVRLLPHWDNVEAVMDDGNEIIEVPSFWAAEVEELPRGAGIEWAALSGVVGGGIKISRRSMKDSWVAEQSRFGNVTQTVVMIQYTNSREEVGSRVEESLKILGLEAGSRSSASWLNLSVTGIVGALGPATFGGLVPCRSLWDANGNRLAAVLVFDSLGTS